MPEQPQRAPRPADHLSDHALLALVARGDRDAFARLYDRYATPAYSLALRVVRDRDLAADVVQSAFLAVWHRASAFDADRGAPAQWLLALVHHRAVDVVRREHRRRAEPLEERAETGDPAASVEEAAWLSVSADAIRRALYDLPDPQREVIELAYFAGYTQGELAERLALPLGTVKSRTFAAMAALRRSLGEMGMRPEDEWNTSTS